MSNLLAIDIGNTNVSLGAFEYPGHEEGAPSSGKLSHHWRIGTHLDQTSDEIVLMVQALFEHSGCRIEDIS